MAEGGVVSELHAEMSLESLSSPCFEDVSTMWLIHLCEKEKHKLCRKQLSPRVIPKSGI